LFEEIAKLTRPQWRMHYRSRIDTSVPHRQKSALNLGALTCDMYLASMARDTQQIRNLSQDLEALEKLLGISMHMSKQRQRILQNADAADWAGTSRAITLAFDRHLLILKQQGDAQLATLEFIGQWLRTWQVTTSVVLQKKLEPDDLAVGDAAMLSQLAKEAEAIAAKAPESDRCLHLLARKTFALEKTWRNPTAENRQERLTLTREILTEVISALIQNEPASPAGKSSGAENAGPK
jgi:hypothetical protein